MILKGLRKEKQITQLKMTMDLNMNQNTISRYENEEREAEYKELIVLADYFNVSIDYLLGRSDDPTFKTKRTCKSFLFFGLMNKVDQWSPLRIFI